jgi:hypothetical protein
MPEFARKMPLKFPSTRKWTSATNKFAIGLARKLMGNFDVNTLQFSCYLRPLEYCSQYYTLVQTRFSCGRCISPQTRGR